MISKQQRIEAIAEATDFVRERFSGTSELFVDPMAIQAAMAERDTALAKNERLRPFLDMFANVPEGQWLPFTAQIKREGDALDFDCMTVLPIHKPRSGADRRKEQIAPQFGQYSRWQSPNHNAAYNERTGKADRRKS